MGPLVFREKCVYGRTDLVRVKCLEEVHRLLEVGNDFFLGRVTGVAVWLQSTDASAVLVPLM